MAGAMSEIVEFVGPVAADPIVSFELGLLMGEQKDSREHDVVARSRFSLFTIFPQPGASSIEGF